MKSNWPTNVGETIGSVLSAGWILYISFGKTALGVHIMSKYFINWRALNVFALRGYGKKLIRYVIALSAPVSYAIFYAAIIMYSKSSLNSEKAELGTFYMVYQLTLCPLTTGSFLFVSVNVILSKENQFKKKLIVLFCTMFICISLTCILFLLVVETPILKLFLLSATSDFTNTALHGTVAALGTGVFQFSTIYMASELNIVS